MLDSLKTNAKALLTGGLGLISALLVIKCLYLNAQLEKAQTEAFALNSRIALLTSENAACGASLLRQNQAVAKISLDNKPPNTEPATVYITKEVVKYRMVDNKTCEDKLKAVQEGQAYVYEHFKSH